MDEAIKRAGSRSELARLVSAKLPKGQRKLTTSAIQYLARRTATKGKKPAQGSRHVHLIAEVAGLVPYGIESGEGSPESAPGGTDRRGPIVDIAEEIDGVEYTRESLQIARWFKELSGATRQKFAKEIERAYHAEGPVKGDEELRHLARPDGEIAAAERGKKKVDKGAN